MPAGFIHRVTQSQPVQSNVRRVQTAGRYLAVSVINFASHQILLLIANSGWGWPGGRANLFAGMVAATPAYLMSRAWVWQVRGRKHDMRREVLPFWSIALAGLLLSTVFAALAHKWFGAGLLVNFATLIAYFILWVAKFFILDRLFRTPTPVSASVPHAPSH